MKDRIAKDWVALFAILIAPALVMFARSSLADEPATTALEEVVVTAQKREINLQEVPFSVSALTGEDLEKDNIQGVLGLNSIVPGVTVNPNQGSREIVTIRGVGFEDSQNGQAVAGVALHEDGVFTPASRALNEEFLDVDRIEVLRGPQGTVFGQEAIGGVINVITKQPDLTKASGEYDVTAGNYDLLKMRATTNLPLADTVAVRASGYYLYHDGFATVVNSPIAGYQLSNANEYGARLQVLWKPTDDLSIILREKYDNTNEHSPEEKNILDPTPDPRQVEQNYPGTTYVLDRSTNGELDWNLSSVVLKAITSYQYSDERNKRDEDGGTAAFFLPQSEEPILNSLAKTFTQELNVVSNTPGPFDWITGLYYTREWKNGSFLDLFDRTGSGVYTPYFSSDAMPDRKTSSAFAETTWHVTDRWRVTGGLRYSDIDLHAIVGLATKTYESSRWRTATGRVSVQYDVTQNVMGYTTVSTGIKPGGVNLIAPRPGEQIVQPLFNGEKATNYEVGVKSKFADDRARLNVAAFYYDYRDMQVDSENYEAFQGGVVNIPKSELYGAEAEFVDLLTDRLRFELNATTLNGTVASDMIALDPVAAYQADAEAAEKGAGLGSGLDTALRTAAVTDINGNTLPKLPPIAVSARLTYSTPIPGHGTLSSSVAYTYKASYYSSVFDDTKLRDPSYRLCDVSFAYVPATGRWSANFMVTNVANAPAVLGRFTDQFGVGATTDQFAPPRQFMLRLGYKFD